MPTSQAHLSREYVSCDYIEHALIMHPRTIYHCCIPVNGKFGSTDICEYKGGDLPIDRIQQSREKYRKALADIENHKHFHCHGCVFAQKRRWDHRYLFNMVHFNHSLICNLHCNFCVQRGMDVKRQTADYDILPVARMFATSNWLNPEGLVFWGGGEPTLLKDFDAALELLLGHGARNEVATNATVFSEAIYRGLRPGGNLSMKTSVDCGTPETYRKMKRHDMFERVWQNLAKYASTGGEVSAKYIISDDNCDRADLKGFVQRVARHGIRWCHIDINHNFNEHHVGPQHVEAATYLAAAMADLGVYVDVGLHSLASIPGFRDRVTASQYGGGTRLVARTRQLAGRVRAKVRRIASGASRKLKRTALAAWRMARPNSTRQRLGDFAARSVQFFRDVEPPQLQDQHLCRCRMLPSREDILSRLPQGGVCVEVGTQTGGFAKLILERMAPAKLHIIDIDYSAFDHDYFKSHVASGQVELHQGDSATILSGFPDGHFDMIYVDGDHSYPGVSRDLAQAVRKIKPDGVIVCNDYTVYSPLEGCTYGVSRAVNEHCLSYDLEIIFLGLHKWGYHDVALAKRSRPTPAAETAAPCERAA